MQAICQFYIYASCASYIQEVDLIIEAPKFINGAGQLVVTLMHKIEPQLL
jgi:hypothetical protein